MVQEPAQDGDGRSQQAEVGAHVTDELHPHRGDLAVLVGGQLDVLHLAPAVDAGLGVLGAGLRPPDGLLQLAGQRQAEHLFGVDVELRPEPAAHRRGHHPDLGLGDPEGEGEEHPEDVGDLGGGVEGEVAAERGRHGDRPPGLHGRGDEPLLDEPLLHHVGRRGEGGVDPLLVGLERPGVGGVGAEVLVDDDPVGDRVLQVDHGRQHVVVDDDAGHGVHGLLAGLGHDDGDGVADVVDRAAGQRVVGGDLLVRGGGQRHRQGGGPLPHELLAGVDGDDAGAFQGL